MYPGGPIQPDSLAPPGGRGLILPCQGEGARALSEELRGSLMPAGAWSRLAQIVLAMLMLLVVAGLHPSVVIAGDADPGQVVITLFWGDGCPHCAAERAYLDDLLPRYPTVRLDAYEVYHSEANQRLFLEAAAEHGFEPSGVPTTIIGERSWVGFDDTVARQLEAAIDGSTTRDRPAPSPEPSTVDRSIDLPLLGSVAVGGQSLLVVTALIGLLDGFNPCSLWVLSVLLAMMLHSGSRARLLTVGLTFLAVTAAAYGVFMIGLFGLLDLLGHAWWLRVAIALLVGAFAVLAIKDYFWFGRGISLSIPGDRKPGLYREIRQLSIQPRPMLFIIAATAVLAAGVALLELPCTAGLPMLWNSIVAERVANEATFAFLLLVYLVLYVADEVLLLGAAVVTFRATHLQERHGRGLKLMAGCVMLALAGVMLVAPDMLDSVSGAMTVFAGALGAAVAILVIHRAVLPSLGISLGDETTPGLAERHRGR